MRLIRESAFDAATQQSKEDKILTQNVGTGADQISQSTNSMVLSPTQLSIETLFARDQCCFFM